MTARVYEFEPGEPPSYTDEYLSKVDLRVIFALGDWREYVAELNKKAKVPHVGTPRDMRYPYVVATAFLNGQWVHETLQLHQLRDYIVSMVAPPGEGPTLKRLCEKLAREDRRVDKVVVEESLREAPLPRIEFEEDAE